MVIEQQISRGYGNIMMSYLIENCLLNKLDSIYLSVDINNSGAISLYKKYDFVEHGIINNNKLIMLRVFTT
jgi:ribosomal protein S18 acetylase RimI-like enzyme